jgi:predicted CoA-binding protein
MDPARARALLATCPTVAVIGVHDDEARPAGYVPAYLAGAGYEVHGVNPVKAGMVLCGRPVRATLAEVTVDLAGAPLDLVDVFRRAADIPAHLPELLAARPRAVWFQLGIRNDEVARALEAAGIEVIQDRCTLADHQRFGLGAPRRG